MLRFSQGFSKRANSANAVAPVGDFGALIPPIEAAYRRRGLPPLVRLAPLAGPEADATLKAAGWARIGETLVMTAFIGDTAPDPACQITPAPTESWRDGFAGARDIPADRRAIHDLMIDRITPARAFATMALDGHPLAWGLAVAEQGWVGIFDIVTRPEARRRGFARKMVASLLAWGRATGATKAYLQVVADNDAGIGLYGALGFVEAYRYHYRVLD